MEIDVTELEELEGHIIDLEAQVANLEKASEHLASVMDADEASKEFERSVADIKKRDNCCLTQALQKARRELPEAFAAYQDAVTVPQSEPAAIAKRAPFEQTVAEIMRDEGVTRAVAMTRARRREPQKFLEYREA